MKTIRILFATIFQNGGDATRAIEIAKALRDACPEDLAYEIIFLSRGSSFESKAEGEGFSIYHAKPNLGGIQYLEDFKSRFGELIGDVGLAREILQGEIEAYRELRPDILIYGFWPIGSIALRVAIPETPAIGFFPLPLTEDFLKTVRCFPNETPQSRLPKGLQKVISACLPLALKKRSPALRHSCIRKAADSLGWEGSLSSISSTCSSRTCIWSMTFRISTQPICSMTESSLRDLYFLSHSQRK
ncbi:hypothetical protein [Porphyromonas sp.]|uniref:hypothetical protein n=1 Tax=Porphyromonas sp. TaxID=1924944 RepID=UPI0026DB152F|nr:hypothetical protein [Porphyromonas sp.]MDO4770607.1 hypothetical protein [Porphyromonas sp.]